MGSTQQEQGASGRQEDGSKCREWLPRTIGHRDWHSADGDADSAARAAAAADDADDQMMKLKYGFGAECRRGRDWTDVIGRTCRALHTFSLHPITCRWTDCIPWHRMPAFKNWTMVWMTSDDAADGMLSYMLSLGEEMLQQADEVVSRTGGRLLNPVFGKELLLRASYDMMSDWMHSKVNSQQEVIVSLLPSAAYRNIVRHLSAAAGLHVVCVLLTEAIADVLPFVVQQMLHPAA